MQEGLSVLNMHGGGGGEVEITGGRTLQLAFIMRLGLSDNLPVMDDEKNTNSVCVFHVLSALLRAEGCRMDGGKLGRTAISLSLTAGFILIIGFSNLKRGLSQLGSSWKLLRYLG